MRYLARLTTRYPLLVIMGVLLFTVFFAFHARNITMTTDIKEFFPEEHPQVVLYDTVQKNYGGAENIMVALSSPELFSADTLSLLAQLTNQIEGLSGVQRVRSLTNIEEVRGDEWGLELRALIGEIPTEPAQLAALQERVLADPMYAGTLVSEDGQAALIAVEVSPEAQAVAVAEEVLAVLSAFRSQHDLYATGTPVLNLVLAESMRSDLTRLFPLVLVLIVTVLYLYFRDFWGVFLPLVTVLVSVIWTMGFIVFMGKQLSPLNSVMPVILVSLGTAYGIYILARYRNERQRGLPAAEAIDRSLNSVGWAVLIAGGTTMGGFMANITADITQMREFGLFTAFGVAVALLVSLVLIPSALILIDSRQQRAQIGPTNVNMASRPEVDGILPRLLGAMARVVLWRPHRVLLVVAALIILAGWGLPHLTTDSNFFNFFSDQSPPKVAYRLVQEKFSGSESVEIAVSGDLLDPAILGRMQAFQDELAASGLVGQPTSIVNILARANMAMHDGDPHFERIPNSRELTAQYLLLLEMSDSSGFLGKFISLDYQEGRIQALVRDSSPQGTARLFELLANLKQQHFADAPAQVQETGIIVLIDTLAKMIIRGQISSLVVSLAAVFLIVRMLLGSWQGSLLSVLLIAITSLINFGVMGWVGIPLDIVTVLISSIGVGVGIDYSIHVYARFQEEVGGGLDTPEAIHAAITETGQAIVGNALAVICGFVVLIISSFPPLRYFGLLVSLIMFAAALGSLTFLPAVILLRAQLGRETSRSMKGV